VPIIFSKFFTKIIILVFIKKGLGEEEKFSLDRSRWRPPYPKTSRGRFGSRAAFFGADFLLILLKNMLGTMARSFRLIGGYGKAGERFLIPQRLTEVAVVSTGT
jgi:hypothetical protein